MEVLASSILVAFLLFLVWIFNRLTGFKICIICAGVSLSWLTLTALILGGLVSSSLFLTPIAILMGGTVVGIAFQGEKKFKWAQNLFYWKAPVTIIGFSIAYLLLANMSWAAFTIELVLLGILAYVFFPQPAIALPQTKRNISEVEKKLEDCC